MGRRFILWQGEAQLNGRKTTLLRLEQRCGASDQRFIRARWAKGGKLTILADSGGLSLLADLLWLAAMRKRSIFVITVQEYTGDPTFDLVLSHPLVGLRTSEWPEAMRTAKAVAFHAVPYCWTRQVRRPSIRSHYEPAIATQDGTGFVTADQPTFEFLATRCRQLARGQRHQRVAFGDALEIIRQAGELESPGREARVTVDTIPLRGQAIPVFHPTNLRGKIQGVKEEPEGSVVLYADHDGLEQLAELFLIAGSRKNALVYLQCRGEFSEEMKLYGNEPCDFVFGHLTLQFPPNEWKEARKYLRGKETRTLDIPPTPPSAAYLQLWAQIMVHGRTGFVMTDRKRFEALAHRCLEMRRMNPGGIYCGAAHGGSKMYGLHIMHLREDEA